MRDTVAASLQYKLSAWLALAIVFMAASAAGMAFLSALDDAHRSQDVQLQQIGFLISRLDAVPASPLLARERAGDADFDSRVVVRFLPTENHRVVPAPGRPPAFPATLPDGLQMVTVGNEQWRVFVRTNVQGVRVAVGQQAGSRDAAARVTALRTLLPFVLLAPLLMVLVGVLLRQMFLPLNTLAGALGKRHEDDLALLKESGLPSEVWPFVAQINMLLRRTGRLLLEQRRFIADAAHELHVPLYAVADQAEQLSLAHLPGEARLRLNALMGGLQRADDMLEQLLALAYAQEHVADATSRLQLQETIGEVVHDLAAVAEEKNITLGISGSKEGLVDAKPFDLKLLVKNVLDNAIRYTPDGGRVDISVARDEGLLRFQVDDTGPGIAPGERERVFDPFYRIPGNSEVGSGLGLAITRTLADSMEATIELGEAARLGGLRVTVTFQDVDNEALSPNGSKT
ncbi:MAG: sensor histidine kinase [Massilia sp.]